jgi:hypothetical protein
LGQPSLRASRIDRSAPFIMVGRRAMAFDHRQSAIFRGENRGKNMKVWDLASGFLGREDRKSAADGPLVRGRR